MRLSISIDLKLHQQIKREAKLSGVSMSQYIQQAIQSQIIRDKGWRMFNGSQK